MSTEAAESLTRFLTGRDSYAHGGKSPLAQRVEAAIKDMTSQIAAEVIAENPELADVIRRKTREAVRQALRDDAYLNGAVTSAVARVITKRALDGDDDGE